MGIQVKIDCRSIQLYRLLNISPQNRRGTSVQPPQTAADPRLVRGGQVSGIAEGSEQFSAGWDGEKILDCTVF